MKRAIPVVTSLFCALALVFGACQAPSGQGPQSSRAAQIAERDLPDGAWADETPATRATAALLEKPLPFERPTFNTPMSFDLFLYRLTHEAHLPIYVNRLVLRGDLARPVLISSGATIRDALASLRFADMRPPEVDYTIENGVIVISTREDLEKSHLGAPRLYNVREILAQRVAERKRQFPQTTTRASAKVAPGADSEWNSPPDEDWAAEVENLMDEITREVAPDSWRPRNEPATTTAPSSRVCTIRSFEGALIVRQTPVRHRAIAKYLAHLEAPGLIRIRVHCQLVQSGLTLAQVASLIDPALQPQFSPPAGSPLLLNDAALDAALRVFRSNRTTSIVTPSDYTTGDRDAVRYTVPPTALGEVGPLELTLSTALSKDRTATEIMYTLNTAPTGKFAFPAQLEVREFIKPLDPAAVYVAVPADRALLLQLAGISPPAYVIIRPRPRVLEPSQLTR